MPDPQPNIAEIDARIAEIRENLRELVEQAAAYSGAADDELVSQRYCRSGSTARAPDRPARQARASRAMRNPALDASGIGGGYVALIGSGRGDRMHAFDFVITLYWQNGRFRRSQIPQWS